MHVVYVVRRQPVGEAAAPRTQHMTALTQGPERLLAVFLHLALLLVLGEQRHAHRHHPAYLTRQLMRDFDGLDGTHAHAQHVEWAFEPGGFQRIHRALPVLLQRQRPGRCVGEPIAEAIRCIGRPLHFFLQLLPHRAGSWTRVQQHQRHAATLLAAQMHLLETGLINSSGQRH